jgi:hypothetical protein
LLACAPLMRMTGNSLQARFVAHGAPAPHR